MNIAHFDGLIAAPFTPMHGNGDLNLQVIPGYYNMLKRNGVNAAFICGSTGEGASLSMEEKKAVATAWANCTALDESFKVIMFLGGTCIADCKELALHAQSEGLFAVSFTAPFYFKPANVKMLANCCVEIASVVPDLPFYYYHIPVLTGVNFPMIDFLKEMDGRTHHFAGIKYTHEDFMDFLSCLNYGDGKYEMMWGRDENMLSALVLGTKSAIGSTYNYAAPLYLNLIEAYNNGNMEKARALQQQSIDMIRLLGKYGGIATGKAFMKAISFDCGEFRLPVKNMSEQDFSTFTEDLKAIDFDQYCSK